MSRKGLLAGSMAVAVMLSGCGGGGGGDSSTSSTTTSTTPSTYTPTVTALADGLWTGSYLSGSTSLQLIGAISPSGQSIFVNTSAQTGSAGRLYTFPDMTLSGGTVITGTLRHYTQQGLVSSTAASNIVDEVYSGSLTQHQSLNGTISSGAGGSFSFGLDAIYNTAIPWSTLAGSYQGKADDGATAGVEINSDGTFKAGITYTGTSQSCIISGTMTPTDGSHDLFTVSASITGCSQGPLKGLAFVGDSNAHSLFLGLIRSDSGANGTVIVAFK